MEHPSLVVKSEIYEEMMRTAIALVKIIQAKHDNGNDVITREESDFANAFVAYAKEITDVIKNQ